MPHSSGPEEVVVGVAGTEIGRKKFGQFYLSVSWFVSGPSAMRSLEWNWTIYQD